MRAVTEIDDFNAALGCQMPREEVDTIGGLVAHALGHMPRRGEHWESAGLRFEVLHAKGGAVHWFKVTRQPA